MVYNSLLSIPPNFRDIAAAHERSLSVTESALLLGPGEGAAGSSILRLCALALDVCSSVSGGRVACGKNLEETGGREKREAVEAFGAGLALFVALLEVKVKAGRTNLTGLLVSLS